MLEHAIFLYLNFFLYVVYLIDLCRSWNRAISNISVIFTLTLEIEKKNLKKILFLFIFHYRLTIFIDI